ncbi:TPA: hypothetical protein ACS727_001878 [Providencia alcalifaciens]|uniref:hypothetical protein n=1 Tax=Providencia TaxID=586 RepID=UPI0004BABA17|nr:MULTISPECIES: hypothetical protein [Providencia]MTB32452.1 hypothetical protein [Providencia alcalifaciens]MTC39083.1 hypothetical protein [Providencia alcalifaciens]MTC98696.1 hypothetical protein [Providencia alcalifaciens]
MIELTIHGKTVKLTKKEAEMFIDSLHKQLNTLNSHGDTLNFSSQTIEIKNKRVDDDNLTDC